MENSCGLKIIYIEPLDVHYSDETLKIDFDKFINVDLHPNTLTVTTYGFRVPVKSRGGVAYSIINISNFKKIFDRLLSEINKERVLIKMSNVSNKINKNYKHYKYFTKLYDIITNSIIKINNDCYYSIKIHIGYILNITNDTITNFDNRIKYTHQQKLRSALDLLEYNTNENFIRNVIFPLLRKITCYIVNEPTNNISLHIFNNCEKLLMTKKMIGCSYKQYNNEYNKQYNNEYNNNEYIFNIDIEIYNYIEYYNDSEFLNNESFSRVKKFTINFNKNKYNYNNNFINANNANIKNVSIYDECDISTPNFKGIIKRKINIYNNSTSKHIKMQLINNNDSLNFIIPTTILSNKNIVSLEFMREIEDYENYNLGTKILCPNLLKKLKIINKTNNHKIIFYKNKFSDIKYLFISKAYNYKKINFIKLIKMLNMNNITNELVLIMLHYFITVITLK